MYSTSHEAFFHRDMRLLASFKARLIFHFKPQVISKRTICRTFVWSLRTRHEKVTCDPCMRHAGLVLSRGKGRGSRGQPLSGNNDRNYVCKEGLVLYQKAMI